MRRIEPIDAGESCPAGTTIIVEAVAVILIRARPRHNVNGTGSRCAGREIIVGDTDLKFLNDLLRKVLHRRADDVINHRASINRDLCRAACLSGNGNACVVGLGGIEAGAINLLGARL